MLFQSMERSDDERPCRARRSCRYCAVRQKAICAGLSEDALDDLQRIGRKVHLTAGQTLLWDGAEISLVGNVLAGMLKISKVAQDGREQIVGLAYPGDFVGRPFGRRSAYDLTALADSELCVFSRTAFEGFVASHNALEHQLLARALDDLDGARRWMVLLGQATARQRVASLLLDIAQRLGCERRDEFCLPFSRQQMGDMLGLAMETVSRTLGSLQKSGAIGLPGGRRVEVRDASLLAEVAEG